MRSKRKLNEIQSNQPSWWWTTLKDDMKSHDGYLHECLGFCAESRSLLVVKDVEIPSEIDGASEKVPSTNDVSLMMRIPKESMITKDLAVSLLSPWWPGVEESLQTLHNSGKLYSSMCDIFLALALAFVVSSPSTSSREDRIARAYLATLPDSSSYWKGLPWRWSEEDLHDRLGGSPLLNRVQEAKRGIQNDFSLLREAFVSTNSHSADNINFAISLEKFSDMLAAVSSRAFVIDGPKTTAIVQQEVALIPILDLCDHCRGGHEDKKKNVSYTFEDGYMVVRSTHCVSSKLPLSVGQTLRLTYGAKGNAQLLLNYGFAIPHNLEPDGSSNDILDLYLANKDGDVKSSIVHLRTGPKSYTYGCLVKALEIFQPPKEMSPSHGELDDMEDFLNEDDGGEHDDDDLAIYDERVSPLDETNAVELEDELIALQKFDQAIDERLKKYSLDESAIERILSSTLSGPDYYSALLIQSEMRTLHFFSNAVHNILAILQKQGQAEADQCKQIEGNVSTMSLVESQIAELTKAYMIIRHSGML